MRLIRYLVLPAIVLGVATLSADDLKPVAISEPVTPGSTITIPAPKDASPTVTMESVRDTTVSKDLNGKAVDNGISVTIPEVTAPGHYFFQLDKGIVPGSIDVEPDKVTVTSVHPTTAYYGAKGLYDFQIVGDNFSTDAVNDHVLVDNVDIVRHYVGEPRKDSQGRILSGSLSLDDCMTTQSCLYVKDQHQLEIFNYRPDLHQGIASVAVRVGAHAVSGTQKLVFAQVSRIFVFVLSAAVTGLLFWIVTLVVRSGLNRKMGSLPLNTLQIFIFDPETTSYSLSKFQLLLFSVTFIFSYLYLLLSGWLVQWQFVLPQVPDKIAALLGISGGTTIASAGLSAARGVKGAGLQKPSGADLISSGGVVIPERFQFFVWTIVACTGFIALLIGQDPASVTTFPDIPDGLLYLMGVSAAGYLGGKAARKPGPVVQLIGCEVKTNSEPRYILTVQGQNLDSKGRFFLDEQELGILSTKDRDAIGLKPDDKLTETTTQSGAADPNFCTQLRITLPKSKFDLSKGNHTFRIVNQDGQFSDYTFPADPPAVTAVYWKEDPGIASDSKLLRLPASTDNIQVIVRGANLSGVSVLRWRGQGDDDFREFPATYTRGDTQDTLSAQFAPGSKGAGTLNVTTNEGYVTGVAVSVVSPEAIPKSAETPKTP